ncbi:MAG TPA: sugar ABC transporter substrate-binding protein [Ilumatobacter sp.]|nr:sugar ABC transporter substrate-binding protein [Ilumatobacter sp.]
MYRACARRWLAAAAAVSLTLAACGGDDDSTVDTDVPSTQPATDPPATGAPDTAEPPATDPAEPGGTGTIDTEARAKAVDLSADELAAVGAASSGQLVGIVAATMATEYHATLNESIKVRAEELGFDAEIFDSREDPNQQLQGIEGFISKGAAAIIITGLGGETIGPVAAEAADNGAFVVQVAGRDLADIGAVTLSVEEFDIANAAGVAAGEYAAATYGDEPIQVVITDYPTIESLVARADMIQEGFESAYSAAEFLPRILGGTPENGVTSMETALQANPTITGVLGINDAGNLGAYQALLNAGKGPDDVFIFGIDCDPQAVELIDSGTMYKGCVDTNPVGTGELAVDAFAKWVAGGTVPGILEVPVFVYSGS